MIILLNIFKDIVIGIIGMALFFLLLAGVVYISKEICERIDNSKYPGIYSALVFILLFGTMFGFMLYFIGDMK